MSEVRVGQVFAQPETGERFEVVGFSGAQNFLVRVRRLEDNAVFGYARRSFAERWTLVQDVPAVDPCPKCTDARPLEALTGVDPCQAQDDEDYFPACNVCEHCDECLENRRQAEAHKARVACQALRDSLPVSGEFMESAVAMYYSEPFADSAYAWAHADLRSKVSTLREWPCCPTSKQPLSIEASVKKQPRVKYHLAKAEYVTCETLRVWTAAFTCACGGGK